MNPTTTRRDNPPLFRRFRALAVGAVTVLFAAGCASPRSPATPDAGRTGAGPATAQTTAAPAADFPRPGAVGAGQRAEGRNGMVVASHPLAAEAGLEMLRRGGNAVDAAVATAFALGVVEPMMGGMGGGGSLTLWMPGSERAEHLEFYGALGGTPDYALEREGEEPTPERGVAVPGTVAGLLGALERWGSLDRETVIAPAIRLARDGFIIHSLLAREIEDNEEKLTHSPAARIFYPGGEPLRIGDRLVRPELARTLQRVAREGEVGFYRGEVAREIVDVLRAGGSTLTLDDFARYRPNLRRPACTVYDEYVVLTAAPPMGGVELLEALNLIEPYDFRRLGAPAASPAALSVVVDAIRIARADRGAWIGDPDAAGVPAAGLSSEAFAAERRPLMRLKAVPDSIIPGDPWDEDTASPPAACARIEPFPAATLPPPPPGENDGPDDAQTTHLSVVDADGNAVSLTFTMGLYFGTGAYAAGLFLNSAGYNFGDDGANVRAPYRTAASTTSPTIVLEGDDARLVVGSPGSGRIPGAILHTILYTLDLGYDLAEAVAMPRVYPYTNETVVQVEDGIRPEALVELRRRGYDLRARGPRDLYFGGISAILARPDGMLIGVADPRRNGAARAY